MFDIFYIHSTGPPHLPGNPIEAQTRTRDSSAFLIIQKDLLTNSQWPPFLKTRSYIFLLETHLFLHYSFSKPRVVYLCSPPFQVTHLDAGPHSLSTTSPKFPIRLLPYLAHNREKSTPWLTLPTKCAPFSNHERPSKGPSPNNYSKH